MHAFTRVGRRLKAKQPGDTIDHSAHLALFVLRCNGALRLSDLAAQMELDASTASRHVRALEQLGLVRRSPDPDDGRAFRVELTEQGIEQWRKPPQAAGWSCSAAAMDGWTDADIQTFERADDPVRRRGHRLIDDPLRERLGRQGLGRGRSATAPPHRRAPYRRRLRGRPRPAPRENTDKNLESTR